MRPSERLAAFESLRADVRELPGRALDVEIIRVIHKRPDGTTTVTLTDGATGETLVPERIIEPVVVVLTPEPPKSETP